MADAVLIAQCAMWCQHKELKPLKPDQGEAWLYQSAVRDFKGGFADLNTTQRRLIAGLAG